MKKVSNLIIAVVFSIVTAIVFSYFWMGYVGLTPKQSSLVSLSFGVLFILVLLMGNYLKKRK